MKLDRRQGKFTFRVRGRFWFSVLSVFALNSCIGHAVHPVIEPIRPKSHGFWNQSPMNVDSLQPVFTWKPRLKNLGPDVTYELLIRRADLRGRVHPQCSAGPVVLYRVGLRETEFQLDRQLQPNTVYIWSVRIRQGTTVSDWADYDYQMYSAIPGAVVSIEKSLPFVFKTPLR
jgi:hypothetical protein